MSDGFKTGLDDDESSGPRSNPFTRYLAHYRTNRGISQSELARIVRVDHSYISRLESGHRRPAREKVVDIATMLELNAAETRILLYSAGFIHPNDVGLALSFELIPERHRTWVTEMLTQLIDEASRAMIEEVH